MSQASQFNETQPSNLVLIDMSLATNSDGPFFGTFILVTIRIGLFATCRKFIDRSLYDELKQISQISPTENPALELDILPQPTASPTSGRKSSGNDSFHSSLSKTLFALCFSESCVLFLLVMCQALNVFNTHTCLLNWKISFYTLLLNIVILIPVSLCVVSTTPSGSTSPTLFRRRALAVLAPLLAYFLLLSYVPLPGVLVSEESTTFTLVMARYNVLGIFILGSLSGFGSVATSWGYFPLSCGNSRHVGQFLFSRKTPSRAELDRAEQSLERVRVDLASKREDVTSLKRREASQTEGVSKSSWVARVASNIRGDNELSNAEAELSALTSLEENMSSELRYLQQQYAEASFDRTWQGRLFVLMRHATGFYCIFRSLVSLSNIFVPAPHPVTPTDSDRSPDLLASTFLLLIPQLSPAAEAKFTYATRQVNLVLIGAVIIGSIRRVLRGVARALRATPASRNRVASLVLLALAQLMLRTSFPPATDGTGVGLFSMLPVYETFGAVFDGSFLASASLAVMIEWIRGRAQAL
ncbi:Abscisic acid G-protein coupled receptor-domain-containing protein [Multifurca ochricompacta]|uniref:Abscisic acid G-protein coupled receptor-domain-containing protein n=1 Tax=Multifurca ochricompacta TaxID=376703 RepID=A0AAD4M0N9_9AGAM|nr:Abscisic acid G-protein coupled receptor-domain-containing protein [Multifurca ochricompacta]